jgi:hypothetical protein
MKTLHFQMRVSGRDSMIQVRQLREVLPADAERWHRPGLFEVVEVTQADRRGTFDATDSLTASDFDEIRCVAWEVLNEPVAVSSS